eukprot:ANDGO_05775.mRNA.1 Poly(A) ribonuclease pop2
MVSAPADRIREVWAFNLDREIDVIASLLPRYPFISMDTEFPGIVAKPAGYFRSPTDRVYQTVRCNVNNLKLIQVGLTLCDEHGNVPDGVCCWQFNFKFNLSEDFHAPDSIDLLSKSGIRFPQLVSDGIEADDFAELVLTSGLVLSPSVTWITFHAGYDFAYLLRVLTGKSLPTTEEKFFLDLLTFFPVVYDVKHLMKCTDTLKGGLDQLADDLGVERIGAAHQAGSDSMLTQAAFFKLVNAQFKADWEAANKKFEEKYCGAIHGLSRFKRPADAPFY